MTDREKAIVMAYTGVCMLAGDKLGKYYEYCSELLGHPAFTHEIYTDKMTALAEEDFLKLCETEDEEDKYRWHDLKKNANDLPINNCTVLIAFKGYNGSVFDLAMYSHYTHLWGTVSASYKENEIVAWKYIEPFKESNND